MGRKLNNLKATGPHSARNRKLRRREDAEARDAERAQRTVIQQLNLIGARPGRSKKERSKLLAESA